MVSKPILPKKGKLRILLDSQSFDNLLSKGDQSTRTLLKYPKCELFEFVRTPLNTDHDELRDIPALTEKYDDRGNLIGIEIVLDECQSLTAFNYRMQDVDEIGKTIHNKQFLSADEKEALISAFIQAALNRVDDMNIMVTDNEVLLRNRLWFESHFPGCVLNIAMVEEAKEIMDLFSKYRSKYYISNNYLCNKGAWYSLSFRAKIPNYHVGDNILDALASRFVYLLMSIDEMGFQYYSGVNNDTMESMIYHFNYFISLASGIFDNLAIRAKNQFNLKFRGDNFPPRTSLNPSAGKEFLKALRDKNSNLRELVNDYVNLIKLISHLRELVIHREMLPKSGFKMHREWKANFIEIDKNTTDLVSSCGDRNQEYEPMTQWGLYKLGTNYFLEPFHFSKAAATLLFSFSNRYLDLLGFSNFIEDMERQGKKDTFLSTIKIFKRDSLGF
jgi:hypothetical protein